VHVDVVLDARARDPALVEADVVAVRRVAPSSAPIPRCASDMISAIV
jgi:hypothetical protein